MMERERKYEILIGSFGGAETMMVKYRGMSQVCSKVNSALEVMKAKRLSWARVFQAEMISSGVSRTLATVHATLFVHPHHPTSGFSV